MIHLPKGQFYGQTTETVYLDGITTAYGMPYAHPQVAKMLSEYILPAVLK
ncbi:MAG: hypothetical protein IPO07_17010 [Haliscomenobacter sp.]|nr:hypothetical protein [Haliscomenobacter sp.]MBK9490282.1 hypothetical protein [Haliscomenobacter sp.]